MASRAKPKRTRAKTATKPPSPPEAPAFWFGFEVSWAKLALARVVVFSLLALDALLQIRHAPRYGAGGFNVAQLPGLDALGPTRTSYGIGQLVEAYLLVLAACGVATRVVVPTAAAIYAWLYFGSQLDSYQHHYLVALVLAIASFVPWQRPVRGHAATRVRTWAVRLILIQLAVLYVWAAISKMSPAWLDGRTLDKQIGGSLRGLIDHTIGLAMTSKLVLATELTLACTVWVRPAWWVAAPLGILFHLGIVFTGLEIGLFAWLMIGMYILVVPDVIWVWIAERRWPWIHAARGWRDSADAAERPRGWGWLLVSIVAGGAFALACRIEDARWLGLLLTAVPIAIAVRAKASWSIEPHRHSAALLAGRSPLAIAWIGAAHALALGLWLVVDRDTTVTTDYARLWGGAARHLGDLETSERAYKRLADLSPDDAGAHLRLGRALLELDRSDAGLAELHVAEAMDPASASACLEEARWLGRHGRTQDAIAKAREGTFADPASRDAHALLDALTTTGKVPPSADTP